MTLHNRSIYISTTHTHTQLLFLNKMETVKLIKKETTIQ